MYQSRVGIVTHYFGQIGVAVVNLERDLALGDHIQFVRRGFFQFDQEVTSIQIEHKSLQSASAGQEIALRVIEPVRKGTEIYFTGE